MFVGYEEGCVRAHGCNHCTDLRSCKSLFNAFSGSFSCYVKLLKSLCRFVTLVNAIYFSTTHNSDSIKAITMKLGGQMIRLKNRELKQRRRQRQLKRHLKI